MQGGDGAQDVMICCEACGTAVPSYEIVSYGSSEQRYRELCNRYLNAEVASALGLENFEIILLRPVVMTDCAGEKHEFHFRMRLLESMTTLDAFELTAGVPGGYQFQILGAPEDEPLTLLCRLIERMRRSLAVKYLLSSDLGALADFAACGHIEWDSSDDGRSPLLGRVDGLHQDHDAGKCNDRAVTGGGLLTA